MSSMRTQWKQRCGASGQERDDEEALTSGTLPLAALHCLFLQLRRAPALCLPLQLCSFYRCLVLPYALYCHRQPL